MPAIEAIKDERQFIKRVEVFSDVQNISAGDRSTGKIETKSSIHAIAFVCTDGGVAVDRAKILTDIDTIVIRAEGKVIREMTATQILDLYKYNRDDMVAFTNAGIIMVEFSHGNYDLAQLNNEYALGMLNPKNPNNAITLTYEINYKAGLTYVDRIEVRAIVDDRQRVFGRHIRITPHTRDFASTGNQDITDLPKDVGSKKLLEYHFVLGDGAISEITIKQGSKEVYDQLPKTLLEQMLNNSGFKVQSGYFHVPFNLDNDPRGGLVLTSGDQWLVKPYWSTTPDGSYTILEVSEHYGL